MRPYDKSQHLNMIRLPHPPYRRLRAFAFDPILSRQIDTNEINEVAIGIPWDNQLAMGPVDSYLEVVDFDPASQAFYAPVDLNDPYLLAQDGLPPSESNPQFHQQMAYAIARTTINHFEFALGRRTLWSTRVIEEDGKFVDEFVNRLRIYPHALREANAYYSPERKALLFGYFPASAMHFGQNMPGEMVFTCLSHDIVAHETTHALIDGLHPRFIEPSNLDALALHEAIADIVALFQHFSYPKVLKHQIIRTKGDLEGQNLLGELAYQFGQATECYGALRSAIGTIDPKTKSWVPKLPDPAEIMHVLEPHGRGAILVAAVFDAFLAIYKARIRDLLRIATIGTGIFPSGEIHPDLVERLAQEAAKTAQHVLHMCIRALDYCPPVDINFGDYLRALITADLELVTDDPHNYRLAVIEAFRRRGIYPRDIRNLSVESLIWHVPTDEEQKDFKKVFRSPAHLRELVMDWGMESDRKEIFEQSKENKKKLHNWFKNPRAKGAAKAARILLDPEKAFKYQSVCRDQDGIPTVEVHSLRPARRIGPGGQTVTELVAELTQSRRGYLDVKMQEKVDRGGEINPPEPDFIMRGGCTLLIDPANASIRYCIYKDITSSNRLERMRGFLKQGAGPSLRSTYFGDANREHFARHISGKKGAAPGREPFALLHRSTYSGEEV
jgi:hypothetical protein